MQNSESAITVIPKRFISISPFSFWLFPADVSSNAHSVSVTQRRMATVVPEAKNGGQLRGEARATAQCTRSFLFARDRGAVLADVGGARRPV
jgi:hypothetical protein